MIIKKQIKNFILYLINLLDKDESWFYKISMETRGEEILLHVTMISGLRTGIVLKPKSENLFVEIFDFITGLYCPYKKF